MNLIKLLNADLQTNLRVFNLIEQFYLLLLNKDWLKNYILWELELLKNLGYDLKLDSLVNKKIINNKVLYLVESSTEKKIVPKFLIDKNNDAVDLKTLLKGLRLVGDFLEKTILKPSNISQPLSRVQFINTLK